MRRQVLAANAAMLVAAVLFGGAVVATRVAVREVPPLSLAVLRYALGGLLLLLCLVVGARRLLRVRGRDLPYLALLGLLLFALFPLAFNAGLRLTEATRGSLMLATVPFWSALLARRAGQERLAPRQVAGLALTFAGVAVALAERGLQWQGQARALAGDGLLLLAALCGAAHGVLVRRAYARYAPLTVTAYGMLAGTLALAPAALAEGLPSAVAGLDGRAATLVLYLGVPAGGLGWYLLAFARARLTPTQAAVYINLNPLTAIALGAALLGERVTPALAVAFAISLTGVALVNWPAARGGPRAPVAVGPAHPQS